MVVKTNQDFFIYSNGKKIWLVLTNSDDTHQIFEANNVLADNFVIKLNKDIGFNNELYRDFWKTNNSNPYAEITFTAITNNFNYINDTKNVDLSDFYEMEEMKKLSKIIQKKFRKLNKND